MWLIPSIAFGNAFCSFYAPFKVSICACHFQTSIGDIYKHYSSSVQSWQMSILKFNYNTAGHSYRSGWKKKRRRGRKKEKGTTGLVSFLVAPGRKRGQTANP